MKRRGFIAALAAAPALAQTPREVAVGAYLIPGTPSDALFKDFGRRLAADSAGALKPNMLVHGEGGSEEQVLIALRRGRIHVASLSTLILSSIIPEMGLLSAPYLFDSQDEFDFVLDSTIVPEANALAAAKGLVALRWIELGPNNLYAKKPILTPADAKGVRIRVSQDPAASLFLKAVGADVIYLASPDVVPGLQTGLIAGGITPTIGYAQTGITPEAPHLSVIEYTEIGNLLVANKSWLDGLPADQAKVVTGAFASNAEIRTVIRRMVADSMARQKELGFTAYELNASQRAEWRAAANGVTTQLIGQIGGGAQALFDAIQRGRAAFAARKS